jgi:hypothetical protein
MAQQYVKYVVGFAVLSAGTALMAEDVTPAPSHWVFFQQQYPDVYQKAIQAHPEAEALVKKFHGCFAGSVRGEAKIEGGAAAKASTAAEPAAPRFEAEGDRHREAPPMGPDGRIRSQPDRPQPERERRQKRMEHHDDDGGE